MADASLEHASFMDSLPAPARHFFEGMKSGPGGLVLADSARDRVVEALVDQARRGIGLKAALESMMKLAASCDATSGANLSRSIAEIVNLLGPRLANLESEKAAATRNASAMLGNPTRSFTAPQSASADAVKPWQLRSRGA